MSTPEELTRSYIEEKDPEDTDLIENDPHSVDPGIVWLPEHTEPPVLLVTGNPPGAQSDPPKKGFRTWWRDQQRTVLVSIEQVEATDGEYTIGVVAWKHSVDPITVQIQGEPKLGLVGMVQDVVHEATQTVLGLENGHRDWEDLEESPVTEEDDG